VGEEVRRQLSAGGGGVELATARVAAGLAEGEWRAQAIRGCGIEFGQALEVDRNLQYPAVVILKALTGYGVIVVLRQSVFPRGRNVAVILQPRKRQPFEEWPHHLDRVEIEARADIDLIGLPRRLLGKEEEHVVDPLARDLILCALENIDRVRRA